MLFRTRILCRDSHEICISYLQYCQSSHLFATFVYINNTHRWPFTNIDQLKAQQVIAFIIKYAIKLRIKSQTPAVEPLMFGNK